MNMVKVVKRLVKYDPDGNTYEYDILEYLPNPDTLDELDLEIDDVDTKLSSIKSSVTKQSDILRSLLNEKRERLVDIRDRVSRL